MRDEALHAIVGSEGCFDSSGHFTIGKRARQRSYRHTEPDYYLKGWVRAANVAGAAGIEIVSNADEFSVSYDGAPFTLEQLSTLTDLTLAPHSRRGALAETSLGIAAALQRGHREISVTSWDGRVCHRLVFTRKQTEIFTEPSDRRPGVRMRAARALLGGLKLAVSRLLARNQEPHFVAHSARFSPVPITINGEPVLPPRISRVLLSGGARGQEQLQKLVDRQVVSPTFEASDLLTQVYVEGHGRGLLGAKFLDEFSGKLISPPASRIRARESAEGYLAILGVEVAMEREASIEWVKDGVVVCRSHLELGCPGIVGTVAIPDVDLDAGHAALVENEKYEAMLTFLREQVRHVREQLEGEIDRLPHQLGEHVRKALNC